MSWLVRLYPPGFRRRYGQELAAMLEQESLSLGVAIDVLAGALDAWLTSPRKVSWGAQRHLPLPILLTVVLAVRTAVQGLIYLSPQPAALDLSVWTLLAVLVRRRLHLSLGGAVTAAFSLEATVLAARWLLPGYPGLIGLLLWSAFVCWRLRTRSRGWPRPDGEGGAGAGVPANPRPDPAPIAVGR